MNRIDKLHIKNFKFFQAEDPIVLSGNHMLLYGENGSGKSSVYWSLYTLFEASLKADDDDIRKYFSKTIKKEDCLVNIHATEVAPNTDDYDSFIEVTTDDDPAKPPYKISISDVSIRGKSDAKFVNYASDFINYKMLLGLSSFRHSDRIDLFDLFVEDIFKYVQFSKVEITRINHPAKLSFTNAFEIWQQIEQGMEFVKNASGKDIRAYKNSPLYNEFVALVRSFNESLQKLLDYINIHAPNYFKKLGYNFSFVLSLERETSFKKGDTTYKEIPFVLRITIPEYEHVLNAIDKPHSFLNEAKLSAIAISIRLAILSQKLKENCLKFIVLDDLLISLDMRNREKVLDLFLAPEISENYQLLILTHDKTFYQMAKHKIDLLEQTNWVYFEMYETKGSGTPKPFIRRHKTYLEKAKMFFDENNLEEAANNLRKAAEAFCKKILAKSDTITEDYSDLDLNGMLNKCNNFAVVNGLDKAVFDELDKHRKFILNASSHDDIDTPKFKNELEECLNLFHNYFSKVKIKNILAAGTQLHFDLIDGKTRAVYLFEVRLDDNFKLYKEPGKSSVLIKGRINYTIKKDGTVITIPEVSDFRSIQKLYDDPYRTSDQAKNKDFWEEVIRTEINQPLKTVRVF
jgi:ABC-type dipeptide/oligopeptide/nickel transport system ATPase component